MTRFKTLTPVLLLLLLHVALRTHNIDAHAPYIDEGFHAARAQVVWDFDQHPGRFGQGKILLYFWLGIFEASPNSVFLITSRLSMGIWSLTSAASVYGIGRLLRGHKTGLIALTLYAFMPFALFFERMGMADPYAAGFAGMLAWRSLIFARKPRLREGLFLGVFMGLAAFAKLTMVLTPLIPISAALLYGSVKLAPNRAALQAWLRAYAPPLILSAIVVILIWLPNLLPVYLADRAGDPHLVINSYNVERPPEITISHYIKHISWEIEDFTTRYLWLGLLIGLVLLLILRWRNNTSAAREIAFLLVWFGAIVILPILTAHLIASRYFMPISAPLVLALALLITQDWQQHLRLGWGWLGRALMLLWLLAFALPFIQTALTQPSDLPLSHANSIEYQGGALIGERGAAEAAAVVNTLPPDRPVYITWSICHMMLFFLEREVTCLSLDRPVGELSEYLAELRQDQNENPNENENQSEDIYLVISGYREDFFQRFDGLGSEALANIQREMRFYRDIRIWRLFWPPDENNQAIAP